MNEQIFKAYDIRGVYPAEINEAAVKRIAAAFVAHSGAKTVAVGRDVRLSGEALQKAVIDGLTAAGANVVDIGVVPTEMLYFAVGYYHYDGGIQVSASHNPAEFNGLKMVGAGVTPISSDTGLGTIKNIALSNADLSASEPGSVAERDVTEDFLDFLTQFAEFEDIAPTKIVFNGNFGMSAVMAEKLLARLGVGQIELVKLNAEPDGSFPKGRPDPLITENRKETSELVRSSQADLAVAWDADGDRCYIADEKGDFLEGCHLTALLAEYLLKKHPGEIILTDPRNIWAVQETVAAAGGKAIITKAGHTFIKDRMRREEALFAGEMSGHFYFRDFYNADSGLIAFLLVLNILRHGNGRPLSEIVRPLREKYFVSGETNFTVRDTSAAIKKIHQHFSQSGKIDETDGLSIEGDSWRFNVRSSNTEPLLRLNVEARSGPTCRAKQAELTKFIEAL